MRIKGLSRKEWIRTLFFLYAVVVFGRYVLALRTSSYPMVGIDEYLYYSLARSIATKGQLLFRGQAADYAYILYPLTLSPVYLLFRDGVSYYRILQLWNILLMSASVFPIFFLGEKLLGSEKKAFTAAALTMLLPDFLLGELIFSEAILYPLFFTLMYFAYDYIDGGKRRSILWVGVIGGLLYSTKPGAVVPAAVFILFVLGRGIKNKSKKELTDALAALLSAVAVAAVFWALARFAFGYEGGLLSIYSQQVDGTITRDAGAFLKALVLYPYYFILACGIVGVACPAAAVKNWAAKERSFWWYVIAALAVMIIGSAWAVEQVTTLNNIHLRYVAMYIPLMLMFCFVKQQEMPKEKTAAPKAPPFPVSAAALLGFTALCTIVFGCKVKAKTMGIHAQIALSILNDKILPLSGQIWGNGIILLLCAAFLFLFLRRSGKKGVDSISVLIMAFFMLINGILGYTLKHQEYRPKLEKDGIATQELTDGRPYIYVLSAEGIADIGVDVNTRQNNCVVYMNDLINDLQAHNGVYVPYIPEMTRGMASVKETPEVDTLIIDYDSFPFFQLSENAHVSSPYDRGSIFVVHFSPGERLVDSTIGNLINRVLTPGKPGILLLYNEDWYGQPLAIRLKIESAVAQTMSINSTHELYEIELAEGEDWYEIHFDKAEEAFNFIVQDAPITVSAYELGIGDG